MQQSPSDTKTLDEQIHQILLSNNGNGYWDIETATSEAKALITRLITQEQIKELNKVPLDSAIDQCYIALAKYIDNRIAELEATLKENTNAN